MMEFLSLAWRFRKRLIGIWLVVMVIVLVRVLTMQAMYTSECLLVPLSLEQVDELSQSGLRMPSASKLFSGGGGRDDYMIVAFLRSRQLTDRVIEDLELKKELFSDGWDAEAKKWIGRSGGEPGRQASRRGMSGRIDVLYDEYTSLLTLRVHWPTPDGSKRVADGYLSVADKMLREAAIAEGDRRIQELERELSLTAIHDVGVYLAEEMTAAISSLTSIRARAMYAFRVIDPPVLPDVKSWPPRGFLMILAAFVTTAVELGVLAGLYLRGSVGPNPGQE